MFRYVYDLAPHPISLVTTIKSGAKLNVIHAVILHYYTNRLP